MKKATLKALNELYGGFKVTRNAVVRTIGAEILVKNPGAKDNNGNPVDPAKFYNVPSVVEVNNYRRMKKHFKKGENRGQLKELCE